MKFVTTQYPAKTCAFYTKTDSNGSRLSYLCLVQGAKAQFNRLNTTYILYSALRVTLRVFKLIVDEFVSIF
jgi:hypothetical protein